MKTKSVTAVAWISPNLIVLGTGEGEIISCLIENTETYFGGNLGHTIKQHHIIKNEAISGIVSCTTGSSNQNRIILAATNSKLVHFIGPNNRDNVDGIFTGYTTGSNVISFDATSTFDSKLVLSPVDQKVRFKVFIKKFFWGINFETLKETRFRMVLYFRSGSLCW